MNCELCIHEKVCHAVAECFTSIPGFDCHEFEPVRKRFDPGRWRGEWISAEEAIPEDMKDVLVWYEYYAYGDLNKMVQSFGIGHVYHGFWSGDVQGTRAKCLAWMPLPEPFQKKENGGS